MNDVHTTGMIFASLCSAAHFASHHAPKKESSKAALSRHTILLTHKGRQYSMWTLPRAKKHATGMFFASLCSAALFESHHAPKKESSKAALFFWCERWDSNPHGETTRTSNVLVYHSNTLASNLTHYIFEAPICQYIFMYSKGKRAPQTRYPFLT